jgi:hypothetical protein
LFSYWVLPKGGTAAKINHESGAVSDGNYPTAQISAPKQVCAARQLNRVIILNTSNIFQCGA